jgi:hypothetical protein
LFLRLWRNIGCFFSFHLKLCCPDRLSRLYHRH